MEANLPENANIFFCRALKKRGKEIINFFKHDNEDIDFLTPHIQHNNYIVIIPDKHEIILPPPFISSSTIKPSLVQQLVPLTLNRGNTRFHLFTTHYISLIDLFSFSVEDFYTLYDPEREFIDKDSVVYASETVGNHGNIAFYFSNNKIIKCCIVTYSAECINSVHIKEGTKKGFVAIFSESSSSSNSNPQVYTSWLEQMFNIPVQTQQFITQFYHPTKLLFEGGAPGVKYLFLVRTQPLSKSNRQTLQNLCILLSDMVIQQQNEIVIMFFILLLRDILLETYFSEDDPTLKYFIKRNIDDAIHIQNVKLPSHCMALAHHNVFKKFCLESCFLRVCYLNDKKGLLNVFFVSDYEHLGNTTVYTHESLSGGSGC
jgi:hypothetical protein